MPKIWKNVENRLKYPNNDYDLPKQQQNDTKLVI
jgi:hypothetical protein